MLSFGLSRGEEGTIVYLRSTLAPSRHNEARHSQKRIQPAQFLWNYRILSTARGGIIRAAGDTALADGLRVVVFESASLPIPR